MKKNVLKNWVVGVLAIINMIALMIMGSDCESLTTFLMTHLIATGVFAFNSMLIIKYGKKELF